MFIKCDTSNYNYLLNKRKISLKKLETTYNST